MSRSGQGPDFSGIIVAAMRFSPRKTALFAVTAVVLSSVLTLGVLAAVDIYLHSKFQRSAGLNVWGYRGTPLGKKQPGETRVVVLGGSTALGYGVLPGDALPAYLERDLNAARRAQGRGPVRVANLGFNSEGAYAYRYTLTDYRYLAYDGVVLYTGYNERPGPERTNTWVGRHASPIFRLTGYYPILPMILAEKAMAVRNRGDLGAAYAGRRTVFDPTLAERTTVSALEAAERISRSLEAQAAWLAPNVRLEPPSAFSRCAPAWSTFCASIEAAVDYALQRGAWVVVATVASASETYRNQQENLAAVLAARYGEEPRVRFVGLADTLDLRDRRLCYDGMHLMPAGNAQVAAMIAPVVLDILR
jgi:hypothetical protein